MELNERQMALYSYLVKKMESTDYVPHYKLMIDLEEWYHRYEEEKRFISVANSSAYRTLRSDIQDINRSTAQYVILSHLEKGKLEGYKLASKVEEIQKQARKHQLMAIRHWLIARDLNKKARNNGQVRFASNGEKEIKAVK